MSDNKDKEKAKQDETNSPRYIRGLFEQMELNVFDAYGSHIKKGVQEAKGDVKKFQDFMIANKKSYLKRIAHIVARFFNFIMPKIHGLFRKSYEDGQSAGLSIPVKFGGVNDQKVKEIDSMITDEMRSVQVSILREQEDVYKKTTFLTIRKYGAGEIDLKQAVQEAANNFAAKGITAITYKNGRKVNIASYAEMAIRTANHRASLYGGGEVRKKYGNYLVRVSSHALTCELCAPWQGRILIDDVFAGTVPDGAMKKYAGEYPLLSTAINAGLLHVNCRHVLVTYYDGMQGPATETDEKTAIKRYDAEQQQRAYEREIRMYKRQLSCAVTEKEQKAIRAKIRDTQAALRAHLDENDFLRRESWREQLYLK